MKWFFLTVLSFAFSPLSFATGVDTSGGGPGLVCKDAAGSISVRSYDLFEYGLRRKWTYLNPDLSRDELIQRALGRLSVVPVVHKFVNDYLKEVKKNFEPIEKGVSIPFSPDLGRKRAPLVPDGCSLVSLAYYEDSGTVVYDSNLVDRLKNLDYAALQMHEAIYRVFREILGATGSDDARELTAALFAVNSKDADEAVQRLGKTLLEPVFIQYYGWRSYSVPYWPGDFMSAPVATDEESEYELKILNPGLFHFNVKMECLTHDWLQTTTRRIINFYDRYSRSTEVSWSFFGGWKHNPQAEVLTLHARCELILISGIRQNNGDPNHLPTYQLFRDGSFVAGGPFSRYLNDDSRSEYYPLAGYVFINP